MIANECDLNTAEIRFIYEIKSSGPVSSQGGSQAPLPKGQLLGRPPPVLRNLLTSHRHLRVSQNTYPFHHSAFNPTSRDVKAYSEVLDANRDGQVTLADLETLAVQYLCGSGVLSNQAFDPVGKKQKY